MYTVNKNCTNVAKFLQQNLSTCNKASNKKNDLYAFKFNRDQRASYSTKTVHKPIRKLMVANRGLKR